MVKIGEYDASLNMIDLSKGHKIRWQGNVHHTIMSIIENIDVKPQCFFSTLFFFNFC